MANWSARTMSLRRPSRWLATSWSRWRPLGRAPSDVVRAVIYVASHDREHLVDVWDSLTSSPAAAAFTAAATLLGVAQLGFAGQLVEVDITAALPA